MAKMITIVGPTGSGKSAMAMELAKEFNGQIICADSRTIYKGMDIGTAKPSQADRAQIKHYLLDVVEPNQTFSAAQFKEAALWAIEEITSSNHLPIMVGGSGMYVDSVLFDYKFRGDSEPQTDPSKLNDAELLDLAMSLHPNAKLETQNRRRMEQLIARGPADNTDRQTQKIDSLVLGISTEKLMLKQNIAKRTEQLLNNGFIQEVEGLIGQYGASCAGLQSTGYSAAVDYLAGKLPKDELIDRIVSDTMKLVKKQLTWFKRNPNVIWVGSQVEAKAKVQVYLGTK